MLNTHAVLIIDEVRRQITAVELHTLYNIQFVFQTGAFFNSDYTFFTHFIHSFCNQRTY